MEQSKNSCCEKSTILDAEQVHDANFPETIFEKTC